jgi:hypothetical protein
MPFLPHNNVRRHHLTSNRFATYDSESDIDNHNQQKFTALYTAFQVAICKINAVPQME